MASARAAAKEETRRRLVAAARHCFARDGFHAATLGDIATQAGVTTGAIYASFGGKGELFLAALESWGEERFAELSGLLGKSRDRALSAEVARQWARRQSEERAWQIVMLEFRLYAARVPALNAAYRDQNRRYLALAEAISGGRRPRDLALAVTMLGNGWVLERLADPDEVTDEHFADLLDRVARAVAN